MVRTRGVTDHVIRICQQGWGNRKLGAACPAFSFYNIVRYRDKLNTYIYNSVTSDGRILRGYARAAGFLSQRVWRTFLALKYVRQEQRDIKPGVACPLLSFLISCITDVDYVVHKKFPRHPRAIYGKVKPKWLIFLHWRERRAFRVLKSALKYL